MVVIYRQEIINDISLFTSQPKAAFYDELFLKLDLSFVPRFSNSKGRKGFDNHSMIAAFIVMKCEGFVFITDLLDYLNNNLLIAHYCGTENSPIEDVPDKNTVVRLNVQNAANVHVIIAIGITVKRTGAAQNMLRFLMTIDCL